MTSLYDITVPFIKASLATAQHLVTKAEELAATQGKTGNDLLSLKLADDMWPLAQQFNIIAIHTMGTIAKASGTAPPAVAFGAVSSLDEAKKQLADVLAYVEAATPESINGKEATVTKAMVGPGAELPIKVVDYVTGYAIPQITFHLTTTYDILRSNGASLGKGDYLKLFVRPHQG